MNDHLSIERVVRRRGETFTVELTAAATAGAGYRVILAMAHAAVDTNNIVCIRTSVSMFYTCIIN